MRMMKSKDSNAKAESYWNNPWGSGKKQQSTGDLEPIVSELTQDTAMTEDEVYSRIEKLSEVNPMLGFSGCSSGYKSKPNPSLSTTPQSHTPKKLFHYPRHQKEQTYLVRQKVYAIAPQTTTTTIDSHEAAKRYGGTVIMD